MESVCPQCAGRNQWEKLYCGHCGACLRGAEVVQQDKGTRWAGRPWLLVILALLLSLSGMVALLGRFLI